MGDLSQYPPISSSIFLMSDPIPTIWGVVQDRLHQYVDHVSTKPLLGFESLTTHLNVQEIGRER